MISAGCGLASTTRSAAFFPFRAAPLSSPMSPPIPHRRRSRRALAAGIALAGLGVLAVSPARALRLESEGSFPGGRPWCENTYVDFSDPGVLAKSPYNIDLGRHKVVSEEPNEFDNVNVVNGNLEIKIVKGWVSPRFPSFYCPISDHPRRD